MSYTVPPPYLHERLRYEAETGKLYWRHYEPHGGGWNTRYAGTEALATPNTNGYLQGTLDGEKVLAARVIWAMHHGYWPEELDHEDHDRANNRIGNLRDTDTTGNMRNLSRSRRNTSGVTGVSWHKATARWRSHIMINRKQISLGYFHDFDAAVRRRKAADFAYDFHPNHGASAW